MRAPAAAQAGTSRRGEETLGGGSKRRGLRPGLDLEASILRRRHHHQLGGPPPQERFGVDRSGGMLVAGDEQQLHPSERLASDRLPDALPPQLRERRTEIPNIFTAIELRFNLTGGIDQAKAEKAAGLAVKKYCSVHDMLAAGGVDITYKVNIS